MKSKRSCFNPSALCFLVCCFSVGLVTYVKLERKNYHLIHSMSFHSTEKIDKSIVPFNPSRPLTLWSSDFHISPIADIKYLLKPYKVTVIDKSLSGHCHLSNTCAKDLRVIDKENGIDLSPCTNVLRKKFYDFYRNDEEFQSVDAILCNHATSLCEIFMPFGKPLIVIASTRYEIGRLGEREWKRWNRNLELIASKPYNTIAANNLYDYEYLKYFTGIPDEKLLLLPNVCGYVNTKYAGSKPKNNFNFTSEVKSNLRAEPYTVDNRDLFNPQHPQVLLGPARGIHLQIQHELFQNLLEFNTAQDQQLRGNQNFEGVFPDQVSSNMKEPSQPSPKPLEIVPIRDLYPIRYEYAQLAKHPAIVILPYQLSFMTFFEVYRMGIPIFVPSSELLTEWHKMFNVLSERTWMGVFGNPTEKSILPRHPRSNCSLTHDPNNEFSSQAVKEWVKLADFYQWPHVQVFNDWNELFLLLSKKVDLYKISEKMMEFSSKEEVLIRKKWINILEKVLIYSSKSINLPLDINDALKQNYGYTLSKDNCHGQVED